MHDGLRIFKVKYQKTTDKTVHVIQINLHEGKFFITKVLKDANKWNGLDIDISVTGAAILWGTDAATRLKYVDISESTPPTTKEKRKNKRNPQNWSIVIKKRKNVTLEKLMKSKIEKGEIIAKKPNKVIKPLCVQLCKKKCNN